MVCASEEITSTATSIMTNTELTLDQLTAVSGGATAIEYGLIAAVHSRPTNNLRVNDNQLKGSNLRVNDNQLLGSNLKVNDDQ